MPQVSRSTGSETRLTRIVPECRASTLPAWVARPGLAGACARMRTTPAPIGVAARTPATRAPPHRRLRSFDVVITSPLDNMERPTSACREARVTLQAGEGPQSRAAYKE